MMPFWVQNSPYGGNPLPLDDFSPEVRGHRLKPEFVLGPTSGLFLLLALDLSGDIATATAAKDAVAAEVDKMPSHVYVSVFTCQDELKAPLEPTTDRARVLKTLQSVESIGDPAC